jgi:hypothetical protein
MQKKIRRTLYAALVLLAGSVLATPGLGQTAGFPEVKLIASDRALGSIQKAFGSSIALSGDTVLVGAGGDDFGTGSAYVFVRNGTTWTQQAKLTASDRAAPDRFGSSIALSGDTALVGAHGRGSAYVFVRNGTTWAQQAKLIASDRGNHDDCFGCSIALSGDTALVGASDEGGTLQGSAYVFVRNGTTWTQQAKLTANDAVSGGHFGIDVALSGDIALIGSHISEVESSGSAYVFVRNGTTWTQQAKLTASDPVPNDHFGRGVAFSGDTALVGAYGDDDSAGSAYVFIRNGTIWTQQAKLTASDRAAQDNFSYSSVALNGDTALVGAYCDDSCAGSAYVFVRNGTTWTQRAKLTANDRAAGDVFGVGATLSGGTVLVGAPGDDSSRGAAYVYTLRPRRPVLIIPGVGATYAADPSNDVFWLTHRGIDPAFLQIDPLARTYHDLIKTLENVGYVKDKDLFVVNYDWRLPPGPDDNGVDGKISGLTAASISARSYLYAVDYLGDMLKQAAERWERDHPGEPPLDAVDVITHSTGGLVARTYIQSDAYGGAYREAKTLPKINNLIMIGVPNRGASKAWNPLHDNWGVDIAFQMVLSKIINRAFLQVKIKGKVISGPDYDISLASISPPSCQDGMKICFIKQYVPTARALLATYDFIDFGVGFTHVNGDLAARNSLVLDLNAGLDRGTGVIAGGDPNAFADKVLAKVTVIYGTNGGSTTPTRVVKDVGPSLPFPLRGSRPIAEFSDFMGRDARFNETYYKDIKDPDSGDGTVPLESSIGQFLLDSRLNSRIILQPFTKNGNTKESVDHTALPFNTDVQKSMLQTLGVPFNDPADISTTRNGLGGGALVCAMTGCVNVTVDFSILTVVLDPVEGFVVDGQGRRLGFSAATGPVTEIPGSVWFGKTDGIGWIFGPVAEPLRLELTGLGERYYVMVSMLTAAGNNGLIDEGVLGLGAKRVLTIPSSSVTSAIVPGAPVISAVTAGNAQVSVAFNAPASDGGAAITSYTAASSPGGITMNGTNSPIQVTGLTNGTSYTFTVTATNSAGTGPPSTPSNAVTPAGTAPGITGISPSSGPQGTSFSATIDGTNLSGAIAVSFSGSGVTAVIRNGGTAASLPITITIVPGAGSGLRAVTVTTTAGISNVFDGFAVQGPTINSLLATPAGLSQAAAPLFGKSFPLTINGENFASGAVVSMGSANLTTAFVNSTQLTVSIPASALTAAGAFPIRVTNPGGANSNTVDLKAVERGDINGNRTVNIGDALRTALTVGGLIKPPLAVAVGDLNLSGSTNIGDALVLALFTGRVVVNLPIPTITSLSSSPIAAGSALTILGKGFGANTSDNQVLFATANGVLRVSPDTASTTTLTVTVPNTAVGGSVQVYRVDAPLGGTEFPIEVAGTPGPLLLTAVTPFSSITAGASITLTGMGFDAATTNNTVLFKSSGGTVAGTVTASTRASLNVTVPAGAVCGPVTVGVAGQTSNSRMVTIQATSCGIQLADIWAGGSPGDIVVLEGAGFDVTVPANNVVKFAASSGGTVNATVVAAGGTQIHVRIPETAATGNVTVTAGSSTSNPLQYQKP